MLIRDKSMPKLHLRQKEFTFSASGSFAKYREKIQSIKETSNLKYIFKNELDKTCFSHDVAYADKDVAKRTVSEKILKDRTYDISWNPKYDGYQRGLVTMVYRFFDKKTRSRPNINEVLAQELQKTDIKNFKRREVHARVNDNIWAVDFAEMRSLSLKKWGVKYLLCVIDSFTKYVWIKPLKDKKAKIVLHSFIGIVNKSERKPNQLWFDQGRTFCNNLLRKCLDDNDILMHSTHNEGKSLVSERFIKLWRVKCKMKTNTGLK